MTLTTIVIRIAIAALLLTVLTGFVFKKHKSWLMTYVQNFCGAWFLFSGWVKAVDPLGFAYKITDYFKEFESTFSATSFSFLAPMFSFLQDYTVHLSVFMVTLEIVIGLMLLMGSRSKFTSWTFLGLIAFFTGLTGFTHLTGYVPEGVNFFEFGKWGAFNVNNMKVTDCGCFGDFLKLEPKVSFYKDLALLIPAFFLIFKHKDMHQFFSKTVQNGIIGVSIVGLLLYCFSNYVWDIPHADFRPFKVNTNIKTKRAEELAAQANVQITDWVLQNRATKEELVLPNATYMKQFKNYPKTEWEIVDQIKTEPAIPSTKLSEYSIENAEGYEVTEELLNDPGYSVMLVCYKLPGDDDQFDKNYVERFTNVTNPFTAAAEKAGWKVYAVAGGAGSEKIEKFRHEAQTPYPFYMADDILLKTIVRSNPGIVVMKNGTILNKWHYKKLPSFEEVQAQYKGLLGSK